MSPLSCFGSCLTSKKAAKYSPSEGGDAQVHAQNGSPATLGPLTADEIEAAIEAASASVVDAHADPSVRRKDTEASTEEIEAAMEAAIEAASAIAVDTETGTFQRREDKESTDAIGIVLTGAKDSNKPRRAPPGFVRPSQLPDVASPHSSRRQTQELWSKRLEGDWTTSPERLLAGLSHVTSIGVGGFGVVFHAKWCHAEIAVKIIVSREKGTKDVSRVETFQTRRAILTRAWLEEGMARVTPLLEPTDNSSSSHGLLPSSIQDGIDEAIINNMMRAYESKDGFGTPNKDLPLDSCLSTRDILLKCQAAEGCTMTVILMELASIGNLDQVYRSMLRTLKEIAQGLAVIHEMEIVHCDLKPSNILLKAVHSDWRGFNAAICDFGLSRLAPIDSESAKKQKAFGTLIYMSPERLNGTAVKASDIYSLGVILFQLISNTEPFRDIPSAVILEAVKAGKLRPKWPDGIFPELKALYEQCVRYDPLARPLASDVVRELTMIEMQLRVGMAAADPSMDVESKDKAKACVDALKRQARTGSARGVGPLAVSHPSYVRPKPKSDAALVSLPSQLY